MNLKQILLSLVLVDFVAFSGFVIWYYGFVGALEVSLSNFGGWQLLIDLTIGLTFACTWLYRDARRLGLSPVPWIAGICATGSIGLLAYLIRREWAVEARPVVSELHAAAR